MMKVKYKIGIDYKGLINAVILTCLNMSIGVFVWLTKIGNCNIYPTYTWMQ